MKLKELTAEMTCGLWCRFKLSGTGEYHVDRTYDDFEWLLQHLFAQEDVPGIQGVIVNAFYFHSFYVYSCKSQTLRVTFCH